MHRRTNMISRFVSGARAASSLRPLAPVYHDEMHHAHVLRRELDARFYATETMPQWLVTHGEKLPQTLEEWTAVIKKNPSFLRFVPDDIITHDLCLLAVNLGESRLEFVPETFRTYELYTAMVAKSGYLLKDVPVAHKDYQLCLTAIKAGANMADVPFEHQTQETWNVAFEKSKLVFKQMPQEFMTLDICREALIEDLENMQFIPAHLRTREIWLIYVTGNPSRLAEMSEQYQTAEMYRDLMSKNPGVIKYIPHEHQTKEMWLSALKFNVVELGDVPYLYRFAAYELLAAAKNLVVTDDPVFPVSDEAGLVAYTYAGKESRAEKTVCAEGGQLLSSLKLLTRKGASDINLVLIGHSALRSEKIAGMDARDIAALVVKFPIIKKVTLLGCLTVDVKKIDEEIALIKAHQAKDETTQPVCGLILLSTMPEENAYFELLNKAKLDRTFVMIKHANQYSILYLEKNSDGKIKCQSRKLDEAAANEIHSCMTSGKKMAFPKHENEKYVLRSQQAPLSTAEFEVLEAVKVGAKRGTKAHPDYKTDKQSYPFLKSFSVSSWFDMNDSLMKRLAMTIEHTHGISRSIKIKGYPNPVYADVNEKRLIVTKDELYTYKRKFTLFADNLDRRKVEESRKDAMNRMKKAVVDGAATEAKSVVYETKPLEEKKTGWFF